MTAAADRNVPNHGSRVVERLVVAGNAALSLRCADVDTRVVAIVVFEVTWRIVNGFGPGERVDEVEAVGVTFLHLELQSVVAAESASEGFLDGGEVFDRTASIDGEIRRGS